MSDATASNSCAKSFASDIGFEAEAPLHAGNAQVFPDSLYIYHLRSRDELVGARNAGKLLHEALIRSTNPAATSGEIFKDVPQWAKDFSGLESHERDHIRRLLGTTFGLLCHAFRSQQLAAGRDLVIATVQKGEHLTFPLAITPNPAQTGPAPPAERASTALKLQLAFEHHIPMAAFRAIEPALAGWTAPGCQYVSVSLPGDPSRSTLAIEGGRPAEWLTARHLLEMFGVCEHGNRLLGTGGDIGDAVRLLKSPERMYTLPKLIWFTRFPSQKGASRTQGRHTRPGELYLGFYRLFPLELFAAADLALWPPFTPEGFETTNGEVDWTDISPAFRFVRILHVYQKLGLQPGAWPEGRLNDVIPALQRQVCEHLGWPTPVELATRWHTHLASGDQTWFSDPAVGGFRHTSTLQLLALRRDRPGDVVVNNVDYNAINVGRSPGWLTQEPDGITAFSLAGDSDRQATEFWFGCYAILPAILGTNALRLEMLRACTPQVRDACVDAFNTWGEARDGWPVKEFREAARRLFD